MVGFGLLFFIFNLEAGRASECVQNDTQSRNMVERINQRYDDFFRYKREIEERSRKLDSSKEDLRAQRAAREHEIEVARLEFVKNRRPKPDDSKLQSEYETQLKERERVLEVARRCYVNDKNSAEQILKRGRSLPGLLEFGIDEY